MFVTVTTAWNTLDWVKEVQKRGAGEIVLNMMNQDGMRNEAGNEPQEKQEIKTEEAGEDKIEQKQQ